MFHVKHYNTNVSRETFFSRKEVTYCMNIKETEKLIKKLNQRAVDVYRQFGANNSTYQSYMKHFNKIASRTGYDLIESASGAYNIPRSKAFYKSINELLYNELKKTEKKVYTVGRLKKETKANILKERAKRGVKNKRVTKEEIKKRIDENSWVHGFIEEHTAEIYEYEELHTAVKRQTNLTSDEVAKLKELEMKLNNGGELKEYNPFESFPPDE